MIFGRSVDSKLQETISAWRSFINDNEWRDLIDGKIPKQSDCLVYELPNYLNRENEDFAIADMRDIKFSEPHYHIDKDVEIYFVLQGSAHMIVGDDEVKVSLGDAIVINPMEVHYAIPDDKFVIAVVNIPPFNANHYISISTDSKYPKFDLVRFNELTECL